MKREYVNSDEVIEVLEDSGVSKPYAIAERFFKFAVEVIKDIKFLHCAEEYSVSA